jgi:hypothetical protein
MNAFHVAVVVLAVTTPAAQLPIPTPDRAPWEMTFVEVEELAGLPPLATAPRDTQELRVMHRQGDIMTLVPLLRLFRDDSGVRSEFFVFWKPHSGR